MVERAIWMKQLARPQINTLTMPLPSANIQWDIREGYYYIFFISATYVLYVDQNLNAVTLQMYSEIIMRVLNISCGTPESIIYVKVA